MAKYNIVISGYYGFHNAGDEAMLLAILQALRKTFDAPSITVISGNPSDTARTFGVKAVPRFGILPILSSLFRTDLLISGGGSLLQDVTSWKSMIYYLMWMPSRCVTVSRRDFFSDSGYIAPFIRRRMLYFLLILFLWRKGRKSSQGIM